MRPDGPLERRGLLQMHQSPGVYGLGMSVNPRAASGFEGAADAYAQGRPSYPREAIDRIASIFGLTDESTVLDLAAGTGQLSALLRMQVGRTIAVEPAPAMRARITADLPGVHVMDGTAEAIPLPDGGVDAVVVGEAFHWFAPSCAIPEIARVLRPDGGLAMLWNSPTWTMETTPWLRDLQRTVAHHPAERTRHRGDQLQPRRSPQRDRGTQPSLPPPARRGLPHGPARPAPGSAAGAHRSQHPPPRGRRRGRGLGLRLSPTHPAFLSEDHMTADDAAPWCPARALLSSTP